uniref:ADP-ribosyl cyclase/cyclic ADP-ribose hydrolase n=1 Tax=Kalanchoe fedtschenkoi TaxID=63787 RepID=A0A7N0SWI4_KALFE
MAGAYAAGTTSNSTDKFKYQVFLSFRGPDVRHHFLDILYSDLLESGFNVFKDNERLVLGRDIQANLFEAIEQSQLCIVTLSPTFAGSSWCLDELVKILESKDLPGHSVLPVFYHVEPTEVRHQNVEALRKLAMKVGEVNRWKIWKEALEKISRLRGLSLPDTNWREGLLVEKIVEKAREIIGPRQVMVPLEIFRPEPFVQQLSKWMEKGGSEIWNAKNYQRI